MFVGIRLVNKLHAKGRAFSISIGSDRKSRTSEREPYESPHLAAGNVLFGNLRDASLFPLP